MSNLIVIKPCDHFEKCIRVALIKDQEKWPEHLKAAVICDTCETCRERVYSEADNE